MERSKDADVAWLMRWFGNGECCTQHTREHLGSIVARLTLPTANLGDDGELVERLRRAEAYIRIANRSSLHADTVEQAADRLILYREALERIEENEEEPEAAETARAALSKEQPR